MAPVIAAILAGLVAGAVALYRERRLGLLRFLVAARVLSGLFSYSGAGLLVMALKPHSIKWDLLDETPGHDAFFEIWAEHRNTIAGHLSLAEWRDVDEAVTLYLMLHQLERSEPPAHYHETFTYTATALDAGRQVLTSYCETAGHLRNPGRRALRRADPRPAANEPA
jgi:hypothetical protein